MRTQNKILLLVSLIYLALTFISINVPFFWDGTFFSFVAVQFYEKGFNGFIAHIDGDTGGFPLYSTYLALTWKLLGKSLLVSHIAMLPFMIGIAKEYLKLASKYLSGNTLLFSSLLLLLEPVLLTQSILMGYDLIMVYFFLLSLNHLQQKKDYQFAIALTLLSMCSVRGIILSCSLLTIDLALSQFNIKLLRKYLPAISILLIWSGYHFSSTGWLLFSPLRDSNHEALLPPGMMIRQLLFIIWKLNDLGHVFLWLFLIIMIISFRKHFTVQMKELLIICFTPLIASILFMAPLANPVGHKYFIVIFLLLNIPVCYLLQRLRSSVRNFFCLLFTIAMLSGNFWLYPERFGNGWDSSLKVFPYFKLKAEIDQYVTEHKIAPHTVGTQFPLISDDKYSKLSGSSFAYTNVWAGPLDHYEYFLQSNVINTDIPEQIEKVKQEWIPVKKLKKGQVCLTLYKNPQFSPAP
ncbi:MAG: hypothetical protein K0Q95_1615 [Bacteroidota bacterium]|jgi:hypothetical protein|nr:hypothetical protein [Bacteroidota bacterium]